jgi:hypothetical protein
VILLFLRESPLLGIQLVLFRLQWRGGLNYFGCSHFLFPTTVFIKQRLVGHRAPVVEYSLFLFGIFPAVASLVKSIAEKFII